MQQGPAEKVALQRIRATSNKMVSRIELGREVTAKLFWLVVKVWWTSEQDGLQRQRGKDQETYCFE